MWVRDAEGDAPFAPNRQQRGEKKKKNRSVSSARGEPKENAKCQNTKMQTEIAKNAFVLQLDSQVALRALLHLTIYPIYPSLASLPCPIRHKPTARPIKGVALLS